MTTVCVTGASGFLGGHVVRVLLEKGYNVRATVRDPNNEEKVAHLKALPGQERLSLFQADLLTPNSFDEAIQSCDGVFHTASPYFRGTSKEEDFVPPAVQGTLNVLDSIKKVASVKKIVLTSSMAAVGFDGGAKPAGHCYSDKDWSIEDYMREKGFWYALSKTLAEKAAWNYIEQLHQQGRSIELFVINPTLIIGPMLQSSLNASLEPVQEILNGEKTEIPNSSMGFVDVRDTAVAHWLVYEKGTPGRYVCVNKAHPYSEWYAAIRSAAKDPSLVPTKLAEGDPKPPMQFDTSKLLDLGWQPTDLITSLTDTVKCIQK